MLCDDRCRRIDRDQVFPDPRRDPALTAEMTEGGRQSVTKVNHCRGESGFCEGPSLSDPWNRTEVPFKGRMDRLLQVGGKLEGNLDPITLKAETGPEGGQPGGRCAQPPCDPDPFPFLCPRSRDGPPWLHLSYEGDADHQGRGGGKIPTDHLDPEWDSLFLETSIQLIDECAVRLGRERQHDKRSAGQAPHRRNITEIHCHGLPPETKGG